LLWKNQLSLETNTYKFETNKHFYVENYRLEKNYFNLKKMKKQNKYSKEEAA
jgi:hypothetical protein